MNLDNKDVLKNIKNINDEINKINMKLKIKSDFVNEYSTFLQDLLNSSQKNLYIIVKNLS